MARGKRRPDPGPTLEEHLRAYAGEGYDDAAPLDLVRELHRTFEDPGPLMADLACASPDPEVRETALLLFTVAWMEPAVPSSVRDRFAEAALPRWRAALRSPDLDPGVRRVLAPLFHLMGGTLEDGDLAEISPGERNRELRRSYGDLRRGLREIEMHLRLRGAFDDPPGDRSVGSPGIDSLLPALAEGGPGAALVAAGVAVEAARGADPAEVADALRRLGAQGSPEAAWYLAEYGRWPCTGPAGDLADRLATGLVQGGIVPAPLDPGPLDRVVASVVDGAGSRQVSLVREVPGGGPVALILLLNDVRGILDVLVETRDPSRVLASLRRKGPPSALVDLPLARSLLGEALAAHRASGLPVPGLFLLFRPFLGPEPLVEGPHVPATPVLPPAEPFRPGSLAAPGSGVLMDHPLYGQFWFTAPAAYAWVRARRKESRTPDRRPIRRTEPLVEAYFREVLSGQRDWLRRQLDLSLEIESRIGGDERPHLRHVRAVRRALEDPRVPMEFIPYVLELALVSLDVVDHNLADGYGSQREANDAGLAREDRERGERREVRAEREWRKRLEGAPARPRRGGKGPGA